MTCPPILFPATRECSGHGICSNSLCQCCDASWFSSSDFVSPSFAACQVHRPSLLALYTLAAVACITASLVYPFWCRAVRARYQWRSFQVCFAFCVGLACNLMSVVCILRLADMEARTIGSDPLTSLLWLIALLAFLASSLMFLSLMFHRLGKYVSGNTFVLFIDNKVLRSISRLNSILLPVIFSFAATCVVVGISLALVSASYQNMFVGAAVWAASVPVFCACWLLYFAIITRALLTGISNSQAPNKPRARRRLVFAFSFTCFVSSVVGVPTGFVGLSLGRQVAWLGHVMAIGFAGIGGLCILFMSLNWPVLHTKPEFASAVDTGKSTDWVQLPQMVSRRSKSSRPVDRMPKISEEERPGMQTEAVDVT
jgi:hypothetical protein